MDPTSWPPSVGPRTAILAQDRPREEGVAVFHEIICCFLEGRDSPDPLIRHLTDDLCDEGYLRLGRMGESPGCS